MKQPAAKGSNEKLLVLSSNYAKAVEQSVDHLSFVAELIPKGDAGFLPRTLNLELMILRRSNFVEDATIVLRRLPDRRHDCFEFLVLLFALHGLA